MRLRSRLYFIVLQGLHLIPTRLRECVPKMDRVRVNSTSQTQQWRVQTQGISMKLLMRPSPCCECSSSNLKRPSYGVCRRGFTCKESQDPVLNIVIFQPDYQFTDQHRYEIHSSVFLYKTHASGAIPQSRYGHTISLIQRFITLLQTIAINETHVASRYARLLHHLWFQRPHSLPEDPIPDKSGTRPDEDDAFGAVGGPIGDGIYGESLFDDVALGLDALEGVEGMDGLFAMPSAFPYDLSMFLRQADGGVPPL